VLPLAGRQGWRRHQNIFGFGQLADVSKSHVVDQRRRETQAGSGPHRLFDERWNFVLVVRRWGRRVGKESKSIASWISSQVPLQVQLDSLSDVPASGDHRDRRSRLARLSTVVDLMRIAYGGIRRLKRASAMIQRMC
jgi:hypothetical protein